jgi:hypothetical protein
MSSDEFDRNHEQNDKPDGDRESANPTLIRHFYHLTVAPDTEDAAFWISASFFTPQ